MSNHLAIAGVTATLVQLLGEALDRDFDGADARAGRPDAATAPDAAPEVRVFPFGVEQVAELRNAELPARQPGGHKRGQSGLALRASYLVTCIGNEADYEPERLLGSCLGALHAHPVLTADMVQQMVRANTGNQLEQVDLAKQPGRLTVTTIDLSPTELAGLWASLFGVGYKLSCAVRVETVVLEDAAPPPVIYR